MSFTGPFAAKAAPTRCEETTIVGAALAANGLIPMQFFLVRHQRAIVQ